jgi:RapA-like protein
MSEYTVGQRWLSEPEPELGLGMIQDVNTNLGHPTLSSEKTTPPVRQSRQDQLKIVGVLTWNVQCWVS